MDIQKMQKKAAAIRRLKEELKDLSSNPVGNLGITVGQEDKENIFLWKATIKGPDDTPYKGGMFFLGIKFPEDYPEKAPEVWFKTPIYHVNINPKKTIGEKSEHLGHVCISTLNWWKPHYKMKEVLTNIYGLFYMANPDSPYIIDRAEEFRNNKPLHEAKIKYFTKKYALPHKSNITYDNDWDFTYP